MKKVLLLLLVLTPIVFSSCSKEKSKADLQIPKQTVTMKIAFLPVLDSLPFYVAQQEGYFAKNNIKPVAVSVNSPVERDQAMQAGAIDGMLNELSSTGIFDKDSAKVITVAIAREATKTSPVFRILASPGSGIDSPEKLAGVPIGVSKNSVIEYLTDRLLEKSGLPDNKIVVKSVPVIPQRFQLLMKGQLKAATLPDPLAQAAVKAGAIQVINDTAFPEYSCSVLSFSAAFLDKNKPAVKAFLAAWNKAAAAINTDPSKYRQLFYDKVGVPDSIKNTYVIPKFPVDKLPTEAQWNDVVKWLNQKGLITTSPSYASAVEKL